MKEENYSNLTKKELLDLYELNVEKYNKKIKYYDIYKRIFKILVASSLILFFPLVVLELFNKVPSIVYDIAPYFLGIIIPIEAAYVPTKLFVNSNLIKHSDKIDEMRHQIDIMLEKDLQIELDNIRNNFGSIDIPQKIEKLKEYKEELSKNDNEEKNIQKVKKYTKKDN